METDKKSKFEEYLNKGDFVMAFWTAHEYLPHLATPLAKKALENYLQPEIRENNWDNILEICINYFPEKAPEMAYNYIESRISHLKRCALDTTLRPDSCLPGFLEPINEMMYDQIRNAAGPYLDGNNFIWFTNEEGSHCERIELERRISEINELNSEKNANFEVFCLKQELAEAVGKEDYHSAAILRDRIKQIDETALLNFNPAKYLQ